MTKVIHICDICKAEKTFDDPSKSAYRAIEVRISEPGTRIDGSLQYASSQYCIPLTVFICSDCLQKIGIKPFEKTNVILTEVENIKDKLFSILCDAASFGVMYNNEKNKTN